jgi:hypothetical protein
MRSPIVAICTRASSRDSLPRYLAAATSLTHSNAYSADVTPRPSKHESCAEAAGSTRRARREDMADDSIVVGGHAAIAAAAAVPSSPTHAGAEADDMFDKSMVAALL